MTKEATDRVCATAVLFLDDNQYILHRVGSADRASHLYAD